MFIEYFLLSVEWSFLIDIYMHDSTVYHTKLDFGTQSVLLFAVPTVPMNPSQPNYHLTVSGPVTNLDATATSPCRLSL